MRLLRRSLAYTTVGASVAGILGVALYGPEEVKRHITSNGLVRVGRAARAVSLCKIVRSQFVYRTSSKFLKNLNLIHSLLSLDGIFF